MKLHSSLSLCIVFVLVLCAVQPVPGYGVNGGIECAACTIASGIFSQVAEIHREDVLNVTLHICEHLFWPSAAKSCKKTIETLAPFLTLLITLKGITPDTFCYGLNVCHQDPGEEFCNLFPLPTYNFQKDINKIRKQVKSLLEKDVIGADLKGDSINLCDLPGLKDLCEYIETMWSGMEPAFDFDGDKFSSSENWRGSHWRGRDCLDIDPNIYPGRMATEADVNFDTNCNGIWGLDEDTGIPWETKLCASSKSRGLIMFGDSVGAHFHFPSLWFNPNLISKDTFLRNTSVLLDELDWPQYSFSTGFKNITDTLLIQGNVDSVYLRMRKRNLCNHRDYQNVCRNGATSFDLIKNVHNIARTTKDKPVTILLGVFGNDVCNRFPDTLRNMTSTKQFYRNIKQVIQYLDNSLPQNSHVVLIGLVNGSFIFNTLANRVHPIGEYHGNVKYKDVFKWFECMQISPCNGWFSGNETIREETTKRALELSGIMKYLATNYVPKNISLSFVPNPLSEVIKSWTNQGGEVWELFEAVDGFHPNQLAQPIITNVLWRHLKSVAPESIGPVNKFNSEILKQFGDQGGH